MVYSFWTKYSVLSRSEMSRRSHVTFLFRHCLMAAAHKSRLSYLRSLPPLTRSITILIVLLLIQWKLFEKQELKNFNCYRSSRFQLEENPTWWLVSDFIRCERGCNACSYAARSPLFNSKTIQEWTRKINGSTCVSLSLLFIGRQGKQRRVRLKITAFSSFTWS